VLYDAHCCQTTAMGTHTSATTNTWNLLSSHSDELFETAGIMHFCANKHRTCENEPSVVLSSLWMFVCCLGYSYAVSHRYCVSVEVALPDSRHATICSPATKHFSHTKLTVQPVVPLMEMSFQYELVESVIM
jgi:hypothetical protein